MKIKKISSCGLVCADCNFFNNPCSGCSEVKGKTFWAEEELPNKICALYECAINQKKFENCGNCSKLPCKMFITQKDPNISIAEHNKELKLRVERLRS